MQVSNSTQSHRIDVYREKAVVHCLHKRPAGASAADFRFLPEASLENSQELSKTCFLLFPRGVLLPVLRLRRRTVPHDFAFRVWKGRSGPLPDTAWLLTVSRCVCIWIPGLCLKVAQTWRLILQGCKACTYVLTSCKAARAVPCGGIIVCMAVLHACDMCSAKSASLFFRPGLQHVPCLRRNRRAFFQPRLQHARPAPALAALRLSYLCSFSCRSG